MKQLGQTKHHKRLKLGNACVEDGWGRGSTREGNVTEEIRTGNTGRTNKSVYRQNGNKKERVNQEKC